MHNRSNGKCYTIGNERFLDILRETARRRLRTTGKYLHVSSREIIEHVAEQLWARDIDFDVEILGGASSESTKHIVQFTLTDHGNRADGQLRILVWNSYNGECALSMLFGFYRFACANGIVIGQGEEAYRIRHWNDRKRLTQRYWGQEIATAVATVLRTVPQYEQRIRTLESTEVSWEQQSNIMMGLGLPATVTVESMRRRHPDNVVRLRSEDQENNLWNVLNTVNEVYSEQARSAVTDITTNVSLMEQFVDVAHKLAA